MKFDPEHEKRLLHDIGGFEWSLARPFDEVQKVGGLGGNAQADIGLAVECFLVGYHEPAVKLLRKAENWLDVAIREKEKPAEGFTVEYVAGQRYENLSLCRWLLRGEDDIDSLSAAVEHQLRHLTSTPDGKDKVGVGMVLPVFLDAGAYEKALEIFHGVPGLAPRKDIEGIRTEAQMSYVLSRHRLGLEYGEEEVAAAAKKFLNRNVNGWLTGGHAIVAARWIKIIYWQGGRAGLSPKEALLKCFDHLPK